MSSLEFCVFDHLDARGEPIAKLYADRLAFAAAAEQAGFAGYYIAEHHSTPLGHAPSPSVFLAALSQRTERMRIGSMVHVLPAYQPLRLAEEICMLDHLSNGRLDIGVGRGASPYEIGLYGVAPQEARDIFEEALAVLKQALTAPVLSHRGTFFRYYDVPMTMRPLQAGGPPMWYGAFTERNLDFAAEHGLNITLNGPPPRLRQLSHRYRELWAERRPEARPPQIASMYQLFVAETDAEAERIAANAYAMWYDNMTHLWRANNAMPRDTLPNSLEAARKVGSFVVGSADTVREKLQAILEASGLTRLLLQCNIGDMPQAAVLESIGRFSAEVMPALAPAVGPAMARAAA
ncbi:LLM class flavin-dependent oxidoreductase [Sphingomonas naphthae]|uniref:LLM class flavin-dependent oxidoreductase n=1 Tax=Sphingomonas naphthae TaxID=1813468 RepID=A0ABY7TNC7_9SPHN|nr:LLM class flavin-dependent oxidoreductase [Sphingomonas naphthae]WCT74481.1 LLM class flavin-dependent oxidoreductase [Sphingomonas naphthae]